MAARRALAHASAGGRRGDVLQLRRFAAGLHSLDPMLVLKKKQAAEERIKKASSYLESRDRPKETVGGKGYVPPLHRGSEASSAERAATGATAAELSIRRWLAEGGDQGLEGKGLPLPDKQEHHQHFSSDAGSNALNRALKDAGVKPASILAAEELARAEERVVNALRYAIRKGQTAEMELEDAARAPREACAEAARAYNSAVLLDKELFGPRWPLQPRAQRALEEDLALARRPR
uniref:DnaJ homologue subfamily C member 28 conserved domain-containing protein n=1 Tax=Alexandrium catenella TaxID=2925 RepID=A0A7S1SFZ2_ALECA